MSNVKTVISSLNKAELNDELKSSDETKQVCPKRLVWISAFWNTSLLVQINSKLNSKPYDYLYCYY